MLTPIKNSYPTFANPAGIGSCTGYEGPPPNPQAAPQPSWPNSDPSPQLEGQDPTNVTQGPWEGMY